MPYYNLLRRLVRNEADRSRAVWNLIELRMQLDEMVPPKDAEDNLLLATWNIRDLGKKNRRGWGARLPETWFYIAEVISRFDFVAVQEVNQLREWERIMDILGSDWRYIATDETDPALGGNGERMTFVYDRRKVNFQSIAGEIVLPPKMLISAAEFEVDGKTVTSGSQFKRTPFIASFRSGWLKYDICTVHIYYGDDYGTKLKHRVDEIRTIADYLSDRADRALGEDRALILLGDFNIRSPEHKTMKALTGSGFVVPGVLRENPTTGTKMHYDQIAFKTKPEVLDYVESRARTVSRRNAGVVPLFDRILTDDQLGEYEPWVKKCTAGKKAKTKAKMLDAYRKWRTYQFSDHFPMWVRLCTDNSAAYLMRMAERIG